MQTNIVHKLKEFGLKATPQRVTILSAIDSKGHANVEEIYLDAIEKHPTISLATVYKNVTALAEINLLKELAITNKKSKYEISKEPHSHIICKKCGYVEDVTLNNTIEVECNTLAKTNSFDLEDIELNIYGICKKCQ